MEKIKPKQLLELMKSREEDMDNLPGLDYPQDKEWIYQFGNIDDAIEDYKERGEDEEIDEYIFSDSYVGDDEYDFFAYCICNYLGVESGVSIDDAYYCIDSLVAEGHQRYLEHLDEGCTLVSDNDVSEHEREEEIKNFKEAGIDPKEVAVDGDDRGDEFYNPIWFAVDSKKFAELCGCTELADKLESVSKEAQWLCDRIHIL